MQPGDGAGPTNLTKTLVTDVAPLSSSRRSPKSCIEPISCAAPQVKVYGSAVSECHYSGSCVPHSPEV